MATAVLVAPSTQLRANFEVAPKTEGVVRQSPLKTKPPNAESAGTSEGATSPLTPSTDLRSHGPIGANFLPKEGEEPPFADRIFITG
jgi:hypothetical protein